MEAGYEFDSLTELPPLPQVYNPMEYYYSPPPLPSSDFITPPHHHVPDSLLLTHPHDSTQFLHLPELKSFEETKTKPPFLSLSPPVEKKRRRFNHSHSPSSSSGSPVGTSSTYAMEVTRRKKISDKIRSLEKIMPWEKKMSLATVLEETHKYITFLQSQIASFWWMPLDSNYYYNGDGGNDKESDEVLKCLTRQQVLQVVANSAGARSEMYARGVCVFSYEQLVTLNMMSQSGRSL